MAASGAVSSAAASAVYDNGDNYDGDASGASATAQLTFHVHLTPANAAGGRATGMLSRLESTDMRSVRHVASRVGSTSDFDLLPAQLGAQLPRPSQDERRDVALGLRRGPSAGVYHWQEGVPLTSYHDAVAGTRTPVDVASFAPAAMMGTHDEHGFSLMPSTWSSSESVSALATPVPAGDVAGYDSLVANALKVGDMHNASFMMDGAAESGQSQWVRPVIPGMCVASTTTTIPPSVLMPHVQAANTLAAFDMSSSGLTLARTPAPDRAASYLGLNPVTGYYHNMKRAAPAALLLANSMNPRALMAGQTTMADNSSDDLDSTMTTVTTGPGAVTTATGQRSPRAFRLNQLALVATSRQTLPKEDGLARRVASPPTGKTAAAAAAAASPRRQPASVPKKRRSPSPTNAEAAATVVVGPGSACAKCSNANTYCCGLCRRCYDQQPYVLNKTRLRQIKYNQSTKGKERAERARQKRIKHPKRTTGVVPTTDGRRSARDAHCDTESEVNDMEASTSEGTSNESDHPSRAAHQPARKTVTRAAYNADIQPRGLSDRAPHHTLQVIGVRAYSWGSYEDEEEEEEEEEESAYTDDAEAAATHAAIPFPTVQVVHGN
jgi:hypothetical protein